MSHPPKFPLLLLRLLANRSIVDEIAGDLHEDFLDNVENKGLGKARSIYIWTALCSLRPYLLAHKQAHRKPKYIDMVIYHLKVAFRSFSKHKLYTFINIFGLAMGFACSLAIALFVVDYKSMDSFLEESESIYRLESQSQKDGKVSRTAVMHTSMAPALAGLLSEIEAYTRLSLGEIVIVNDGEGPERFAEERILYADRDFFKVFSYKLISGNPDKVLTEPNTVILTASAAKRYFENDNPIGQTMEFNSENNNLLEVVGVMEDPRGNSSMQFDMLAPTTQLMPNVDAISFKGDFFLSLPSYFRLAPGVNLAELTDKIAPGIKTHTENKRFTEVDYTFSSFENVKSDQELDDDLITPSDPRIILIFTIVALLIIGLAVVNYINLSTARALQRSHEVGMRKVAGASKSTLVWQFLTESLLTCLIALPLALLVLEAALPYFEQILTRKLFFNYHNSPAFMGIMMLSVLLIGITAGLYPSLLLSRFKFSEVLKGKLIHSKKSSFIRKGLVIFQFAFSIALIIGAVMIQNQLDFIRNQTLSYNPEQVLVVEGRFGKFKENHEAIKAAMSNIPGVVVVSMTNSAPGDEFYMTTNNPKVPARMTRYIVDDDFFKLFNINLLKGTGFNGYSDSTTSAVMMNEALANIMDIDDPLTVDHIAFQGRTPNNIVGIVDNFHFQSLHTEITPVLFSSAEAMPIFLSKIILKVETDEFSSLVAKLKEVWADFFPSQMLKYEFLDDRIQNMYTSEQRIAGIFKLFTILSIVISCLGLFGLSTFTAEIKMKEISIRKVLGASAQQMYLLLSRQVYGQVLIAAIISVPIAYFLVEQWLQDFAYKVSIAPLNILLIILFVMILAGVTLSFKAFQAATSNPVNNLRNE